MVTVMDTVPIMTGMGEDMAAIALVMADMAGVMADAEDMATSVAVVMDPSKQVPRSIICSQTNVISVVLFHVDYLGLHCLYNKEWIGRWQCHSINRLKQSTVYRRYSTKTPPPQIEIKSQHAPLMQYEKRDACT